jgi:hypothetical protein
MSPRSNERLNGAPQRADPLRRNNSELLQLLEDSVKQGLIDAETLVS